MANAYADRLFHLQDCKEKSGQITPAAFSQFCFERLRRQLTFSICGDGQTGPLLLPEEVLVDPPLLVEEITTLPPPYPPLPPITTGIEPSPSKGGI
ncbi:hypothetical protein [Parasphingorhabdus sp.]|jgi:hypothetical protein|uniref:hypothetical protein n=1 Tax=Parasphingorhabdus sp. TaxID=2709688 RepID=UPI00309D4512